MPGFQGYPFLFGKAGADDCFTINNCLQGHNDVICFLLIKSCPENFHIRKVTRYVRTDGDEYSSHGLYSLSDSSSISKSKPVPFLFRISVKAC
jgi:hypothetical protein